MPSPAFRTPPANVEAEKALLGAIFTDNRAFERVSEFLRPEHFAVPHHGRVFGEIATLISEGRPVTPVTLARLFETDGSLQDVGGTAYLAELAGSAVTIINAGEYGRLIYETAVRRELIAAVEEIADRAYDGRTDEPVGTVVADAHRWIADLCARTDARSLVADLIDPCALDGQPVPERRWLVPDWLPWGHVTALYGDGGTGKSLLAQTLMTAAATGRPWLGLPVEPVRCLGLFCEDPPDELWRRQDAINNQLGVSFADLASVRWFARVGHDNALMTFDPRGAPVLTPLFFEVAALAKKDGAELVVVDTAADTFGGNENIRAQVHRYVAGALGRLAREINGTVLLCAHPSRAGLSTGEGDGGNTAWSNTVRSRLYLERDGEDEGRRTLSRRKANYAARGDVLTLRWHDGAFVVEQAPTGVFGSIDRQAAETAFLDCLDATTAQGRDVSDARNSPRYAPKVFEAMTQARGYRTRDLTKAMERLFAAGRIRVGEVGKYANRGSRRGIVRADP